MIDCAEGNWHHPAHFYFDRLSARGRADAVRRRAARAAFGRPVPLHAAASKGKKETPKKKAKEKKPKSEGEEAKQKKKPSLPKPTKEELRGLITTALSALKETAKRACKRLRIDPLEILVVFGGTDPADIAQTYGYASAAMWGVMPHLEDLFHIPDPSLHLRKDYSSEKTHAEGAVGLSLRIRDGLHISLALLIPMLKWYLRYKKAHKNDAPAEKPTESTPQNSEHSEKLTA